MAIPPFKTTIKYNGDGAACFLNFSTVQKPTSPTRPWPEEVPEPSSKKVVGIVCCVSRSKDSYAGWAEQIAKEEAAYFIDLNDLIATMYEQMGVDAVKPFFPGDHTHTDINGAKLNAQTVIDELKKINPGNLNKYMK